MRFTAEQTEFAERIRAFCAKELGTLAQRDALTEGGTIANSRELLGQLRAFGLVAKPILTVHD